MYNTAVLFSVVSEPSVHILSIGETSVDLFFHQLPDTLPANLYEVNIFVQQCPTLTSRMVVSNKNTLTVGGLEMGCTYALHVIARNTYTDLYNFTSASTNFTTKFAGEDLECNEKNHK